MVFKGKDTESNPDLGQVSMRGHSLCTSLLVLIYTNLLLLWKFQKNIRGGKVMKW